MPWQKANILVKNESYTVAAHYYKIDVGYGEWGSSGPQINVTNVLVEVYVPPRGTVKIIGPLSKVYSWFWVFGFGNFMSKVRLGLWGLTAGPPISVRVVCE